jgi:DNA repair protein RadC
MTRNDVLNKLLSKYGKYGYTRLKISGLIKDGEKHGFSYTMIYNGLRMAFSNVTGEHEYFSLQDMMEITGETQDELIARIEDSREELQKIPGIGKVKAMQILCIAELSKRLASAKVEDKISFHSPASIADYYMERMRHLSREEMILIFFNGKNKVIKELTVSVGTVNQTVASPRELFLEALRCEAVSVLMIHNHPSGDPTPSRQDILTTKRMKEAGEFLGIPLCDHIIIGDQTYLSFREEHMM